MNMAAMKTSTPKQMTIRFGSYTKFDGNQCAVIRSIPRNHSRCFGTWRRFGKPSEAGNALANNVELSAKHTKLVNRRGHTDSIILLGEGNLRQVK
tara:strand:+ start:1651 stop:1935 length:285 start_codon:yes stop_codon:yes gene_type:complete